MTSFRERYLCGILIAVLGMSLSAGCEGAIEDPSAREEGLGEATQAVTKNFTGYELWGVPVTAYAGSTVAVNWKAPAGHSPSDWIGLYSVATSNTAFKTWKYVGSATSGTVYLKVPDNARGRHEFRFLLNDGFGLAALSTEMEVTDPPYVCRSLRSGDPWYPEWIYCCDNQARTQSFWQHSHGWNYTAAGTCYSYGILP